MRRVLVLVVLINFFCFANAQDFQPYFNAVVVSNIDSSIKWYEKVFSLEIVSRTDAPERGFRQANLGNENMLIELIQLDSSLSAGKILESQPQRTRIRGLMKTGFKIKDVEGLFQRLKELNIKFIGRVVSDPVSGKKMFLIEDPDGAIIQFFEE